MKELVHSRYHGLRRAGWPAKQALDHARTIEAFNSRDDVRILIKPDTDARFDDLCGDMFNPKANPDIAPATLARQQKEFLDKCNREGVWGLVGEYLCPSCGEWVHADSVWGFVGSDYVDSGYDSDIMVATMKAADKAR